MGTLLFHKKDGIENLTMVSYPISFGCGGG